MQEKVITMDSMDRKNAIELIACCDLKKLSLQERQDLLQDCWNWREDEPEFSTFPLFIQKEISSGDDPSDPQNELYDPLLLIGLRHSYLGVKNSFLEATLQGYGYKEQITGVVEPKEKCPCCELLTLSETCDYEICRVCFWEDDGTWELDSPSGPNHMTLRNAKNNYKLMGAVRQDLVRHVLSDGKQRYLTAP